MNGSRAVVLSVSALGNLVVSVPMLTELRRRYPGADVTLVCMRQATADLARELGVCDRVVMVPSRARRSPALLSRAILAMRRTEADIALQSFSSHGSFANLLLGSVRSPVRCGYDQGRFRRRLTHVVPIRTDRHLVELNLDVLRRLGHADVVAPPGRYVGPIELGSTRYLGSSARETFGRFAVLSVGSDPKLTFKRWSPANWAAITRDLEREGIRCVLIGAEAERSATREVLSAGGVGDDLAGQTTVADLAALISGAVLTIGTDGFAVHLSAAMGKPTVGIYGPSCARTAGPWGRGNRALTLDLPCSPCYHPLNVGRALDCRTFECLRFLPVDRVMAAVSEVISEAEPA